MQKNILLILFSATTYFASAQGNMIPSIKWLIGNWQMELRNKGKITESWKRNNDSSLQGKSYFIKSNGDSILQETVQLIYSNGNVFYIPTVNGQNNNQPVSFQLTSFKNNTLVFENTAHDFPQKIIYSLKSANELNASIEGISKGKFKKENYPMSRVM